jgi:hypothetical protein
VDEAERLYPSLGQETWCDLVDKTRGLASQVSRELELPATLLVGDEPLTFSEADRERTEGEFRLDAVAPLLVLICVLVIESSVVWALGLLGVIALAWQGVLRQDDARAAVSNAMSYKSLPSPAIDRFQQLVAEAADTAKRTEDDESDGDGSSTPATGGRS